MLAEVRVSLLVVGVVVGGLLVPGVSSGEDAAVQAQAAGVEQVSVDEQERLKERIAARWRAMIAKDFDDAYQFELPSYRELHTVEQFRNSVGRAIDWRVAKVVEVRYDAADRAEVKIQLEYKRPLLTGGEAVDAITYVKEVWLRREDQWWHSR